MSNEKRERASFFHSIKGKITLLIALFITIEVVVLIEMIVPNACDNIKDLTHKYMYDLTLSLGEKIQIEVETLGKDKTLGTSVLKETVKGGGLDGVESSYVYVVGKDGTMLYHPTESKIGEPVENEIIKNVVAQINSGKIPEPKVEQYVYKGVTKYAGYYVNKDGSFIVVLCADESEVLAPINRMRVISTVCAIIISVICSVTAYFLVSYMIKPVVKVTDIVNRLADMDFSKNEEQEKLNKRKDETGIMSRAIGRLQEELSDVVGSIKKHGVTIFQSANTLNRHTSETAATIDQVEKAVLDIAEGATSQANETQKATENVILMGNMVEETSQEVEHLLNNAREMQASSNEATDVLQQLEQVNSQAKEAIDIIYEQTNNTNESALKIHAATEIITSIAEETNLLSLNASIEAAKAGEQGRGFAVVAAQIQKLAEQSNESTQQIENIINSLIEDSEKAVHTMEEVKVIIGKQSEHVAKTEKIFTQVKNGINSSISGVNLISDKTREMDRARIHVVDSVQNLTAIAEENAASTQETSASVTEANNHVISIADNASQMQNIANELDSKMNIFTL